VIDRLDPAVLDRLVEESERRLDQFDKAEQIRRAAVDTFVDGGKQPADWAAHLIREEW